jgi:hypothetical protein
MLDAPMNAERDQPNSVVTGFTRTLSTWFCCVVEAIRATAMTPTTIQP